MTFRLLIPVLLLVSGVAVVGVTDGKNVGKQPDYADVVDRYRNGDFEQAAFTLRRWDNEDLLRFMRAYFRKNVHPFRRDVLQAMLALHTEFAIVGKASIMCEPNRFVRAFSLDQKYSVEIERRELLDHLEQNQPDYTFLEAWYSLAAAYNQGKGDLESAVNCIRRAPDRLRNRPQLLLALGTVHEMAWHERTENGLRLHDIQPDLRVASNAYEQAWTLGGIAEARLRLARVLGLQERHAEALTLLRNPPPFDEKLLLYLRDLFEGDTLERSGDLDAAERAYQGAARTIPGAHSATFALAHLRYTRGRRASALAEVRRNDVEALNAPVDPWLWYLKGTGRRAAHYLETVRTIVRDN